MQTFCYRVMDNGGATFDRYTLCFMGPDGPFCYGASENPFHPQGFGQYAGDMYFPADEEFPDIGINVSIDSLPEQVQNLIKQLETE